MLFEPRGLYSLSFDATAVTGRRRRNIPPGVRVSAPRYGAFGSSLD